MYVHGYVYSCIKRIEKKIRSQQNLIDNKIEKEGFLEGDERVNFLMFVIHRKLRR